MKSTIVAALAGLLGLAGMAFAQPIPGQPNAKQGEEVARKVCAVCHIPRENAPRLQGTADVPTFKELAERGISAERIANTVMAPPHPMPAVPLTRQEIADVAAYIQSLKE